MPAKTERACSTVPISSIQAEACSRSVPPMPRFRYALVDEDRLDLAVPAGKSARDAVADGASRGRVERELEPEGAVAVLLEQRIPPGGEGQRLHLIEKGRRVRRRPLAVVGGEPPPERFDQVEIVAAVDGEGDPVRASAWDRDGRPKPIGMLPSQGGGAFPGRRRPYHSTTMTASSSSVSGMSVSLGRSGRRSRGRTRGRAWPCRARPRTPAERGGGSRRPDRRSGRSAAGSGPG